jgi:putative addiction module component (TIGR02574 family)
MSLPLEKLDIETLTIEERLELIGILWDSLQDADPADVPVSPSQRAELRRRVSAYRENPREGASWEQVQAKMRPR